MHQSTAFDSASEVMQSAEKGTKEWSLLRWAGVILVLLVHYRTPVLRCIFNLLDIIMGPTNSFTSDIKALMKQCRTLLASCR